MKSAREDEYDVRLKSFIDSKIHAVKASNGGDSYCWGYRDAMEEVYAYLDDMMKTRKMLEKTAVPFC